MYMDIVLYAVMIPCWKCLLFLSPLLVSFPFAQNGHLYTQPIKLLFRATHAVSHSRNELREIKSGNAIIIK